MEDPIEGGDADDAYSHYGYAHYGAAVEGYAEPRVEALSSADGGASVCPYRDVHTNKSGQTGANGSDQVGDSGGRQ